VPEIEVFDQQERLGIDLGMFNRFAADALAAVRALPATGRDRAGALPELDRVEVAIVSDEVIASVHEKFMGIPGPTDVITFDHGEIVIGADTAASQGEEFGTGCAREIALYIVHGLLHLRGFDDRTAEGAEAMRALQEKILADLWR
jgi:probable rRNA maturation factor